MFRTFRRLFRPGYRVPGRLVQKTPRVILLASGCEQRWEAIQHKQLVEVHGEPLILRTMRQVAQRWNTRPVVVTHHPRIIEAVGDQADVLSLDTNERRWTVETALCSRACWGDPTLILAGDVYWTDAAIDVACDLNTGGPVRYLVTHCSVGDDILGIWFRRRHRHRIARALHHAIYHAKLRGGGGKLWQAYRSLCGFPLVRHRLEDVHCVRINDETTDFDTLQDYQKFLRQQQSHAA